MRSPTGVPTVARSSRLGSSRSSVATAPLIGARSTTRGSALRRGAPPGATFRRPTLRRIPVATEGSRRDAVRSCLGTVRRGERRAHPPPRSRRDARRGRDRRRGDGVVTRQRGLGGWSSAAAIEPCLGEPTEAKIQRALSSCASATTSTRRHLPPRQRRCVSLTERVFRRSVCRPDREPPGRGSSNWSTPRPKNTPAQLYNLNYANSLDCR